MPNEHHNPARPLDFGCNNLLGAWQPIATAPRDADVWVYGLATVWTNSCPFLWQGQAGWDEDDASWWTTAHDDKGEPLKVIPTHWMPLPPPPVSA